MLTGPREAFRTALEALPGVEVRSYGDPTVGVPTVFVTLDTAAPDPTRCAHLTDLVVLVVVQHDDPELAAPLLEETADAVLVALEPLATFQSLVHGVFRERAPSMALTFQTRQ